MYSGLTPGPGVARLSIPINCDQFTGRDKSAIAATHCKARPLIAFEAFVRGLEGFLKRPDLVTFLKI
jgi:hypothetical protein